LAIALGSITILPALALGPEQLTATERKQLLAVREAVWRAWFANDRAAFKLLVPEETITIEAGKEAWGTRADALQEAEEFARSGSHLLRLEFPRTEIQRYGEVAILYSLYTVETEKDGKHATTSGRATEIFVHRNGRWVNSGWHTDSGK
jgi:ketosteroid isomerase-like protein